MGSNPHTFFNHGKSRKRPNDFGRNRDVKAMIDAKVYFSTLPDGYKRNVIDRLTGKGVYQTRKIKQLYTAAMNKELKGYSATERKFILKLGNAAFMKTMKELIKDEETRNNSDRTN